MDVTEARARFHELRKEDGPVPSAELDEIWAVVATVRPEDILGEWKGGEFRTGHPLEGMLAKAGWYGKSFVTVHDAKPLICRNAEGELYSNLELGQGEASLWTVEFRGEPTATMVYDGRPVLDHFKQVDDTTLMGIMNTKGVPAEGPFYYFFLERVPGPAHEGPRAGEGA
ncbi:DUF4334 domain-containing protein [Streptomyces nitrosporeus]|uniref:DUF4334 domain-containing protein n=1 Tax=Streptomyces nitrosporeus TaxID=28894 RepID=A0A5J6F462_9ACTN|nr:DUF4334 domain-containing protein [Streptomyces nitrosporeus]QEU70827.1 DUF4334 domain-containing protein [Streptomyces nitrosporeus]GGZ21533.1 hypothetical protein GCM10010327_60760 [Streptomyces nitrosporeus]